MRSDITFLDLFSGIGGLSLGFEMAGATPIAAVESNETHAKYYARNRSVPVVVNTTPVEEIDAVSFVRSVGVRKRDLDLIIGGPPCQPFSMAGKRHGKFDERGNLVKEFARFVEELSPRAFLMENVVGLKSIHDGDFFRSTLARFRRIGYRCAYMVLDAADYGVPQRRRRLFVVGSRIDSIDLGKPTPTHGELVGPMLSRPYVTVRDAISDLPAVSAFPEIDDLALLEYTRPPNEYQQLMRGSRRLVTGNGVTKHFPHILRAISRSALPEGAIEPSTRYRRLRWDAPSVTLRAGSGSFTALRPIHPEFARVITVREAARLQSFPDNFDFATARKHAHQQIGNSVPPLLARAIAEKLLVSLRAARTRA